MLLLKEKRNHTFSRLPGRPVARWAIRAMLAFCSMLAVLIDPYSFSRLAMEPELLKEPLTNFLAAFPQHTAPALAVFCLFLFFYTRLYQNKFARLFRFALMGGLVFGLCQTMGDVIRYALQPYHDVDFNLPFSIHFCLRFIGFSAIFTSALTCVFRFADERSARPAGASPHGVFLGAGAKSYWLVFAILLMCWLPYHVIYFPGYSSYDTYMQMRQFFAGDALSNHHALLHTVMMDALIWLGKTLFGTYAAGVGVFTAFQLLAVTAIYACAIRYMAVLDIGFGWRLGALLFYALNPILAVYNSAVMWKDIWISAFTLLFLCILIDISRRQDAFFRSRWAVAGAVGAALGVLFMKKTGLYLFILAAIAALILLRRCRRQFFVFALALALFSQIIQGPVFKAAGIEPSPIKEMLNIPIQQLSLFVKDENVQLSYEEEQTIFELIQPYTIETHYLPLQATDPLNDFDNELFMQDPGKYTRLWFQLVRRYPGKSLKSALYSTSGYWYPYNRMFIGQGHYLTAEHELLSFDNMSGHYSTQLEGARRAVSRVIVPFTARLPVVNAIYSIGLHFWLLLACALYAIYKKRFKILIPLALLLGVWLACLVSPISWEFRYAMPAVVCVPVLLGYTFGLRAKVADADGQNRNASKAKPPKTHSAAEHVSKCCLSIFEVVFDLVRNAAEKPRFGQTDVNALGQFAHKQLDA